MATAPRAPTFAELTAAMMPVGSVVATRYHNVMCALKLGKPVISTGYAQKNIALMTDMGLAGFCQSAGALDIDLLIEQFRELEGRSAELTLTLAERVNEQRPSAWTSSSPGCPRSCCRNSRPPPRRRPSRRGPPPTQRARWRASPEASPVPG